MDEVKMIYMDEAKIKKCPWCKSKAKFHIDPLWSEPYHRGYYGNFEYYVQCSSKICGAIAPHGKIDDIYRSPEEATELAIKIWNTRGKKEK